MTIKRRLFVSNILMVIFPIIITLLALNAIYFVFMGVTGANIFESAPGGAAIRHGDVPIIDAPDLNIDLLENFATYQLETGQYIVVFPDTWGEQSGVWNGRHGMTLIILVAMVVFVFITNFLLTRFVLNNIKTSIAILTSGVGEIKDGNLTYRIEHNKGNEFDAVCSDFNEMATRLHTMVQERQADEKSRKELIAGISHDLKTPLTSLKIYIDGIKSGVASTPEMQKRYFDTIQGKTEDMEYIIEQLFLFSKIDIGDFPLRLEVVDIGDVLGKMVAGLSDEYLKKGLSVSLEENVHGLLVEIDIVQFRNVMQNILTNSVKYGNKEDGIAKVSCQKIDDSVSITIKDNGPGVPDAMLKKIFDVFYRFDDARSSPGSGLGLAISSKIIWRLKGLIRAENNHDGGLSIIITLPIKEGAR